MALSKTYKRNDTGPPAIITVTDGPDPDTQSPVNLAGATSTKFLMGTINAAGVNDTKVERTMSIVNAATGVVRFDWQTGDLDQVGTYKAEVEVTWAGGMVQTFPNDSYLEIIVLADVG